MLVEQLTINHPKLTIVAGLLKQLIGKLITLFKHGRRHELINSGVATMQAGKMVEDRQKLQIKMKEHLSLLKDDNELSEPRPELQEPKPIKL